MRVNEETTDITFWCSRSEASFMFHATFRVSTKGPMESCEGKCGESGSDAQEEAVSKLKPKKMNRGSPVRGREAHSRKKGYIVSMKVQSGEKPLSNLNRESLI